MESTHILHVTLVQVDLAWENPARNRQNLEDLIRQTIGSTDLIIFPETFTTGFSMRIADLSESMDGPTILWMIKLAKESNIALCGSIFINDNGQYFNRFVFITPTGEISFYNKRHLFSIGGESEFLIAGHRRVIVNYLGWRIALYVCYDLRFPVWCRNAGDTDLMIFSANWPDVRREVWNTLLKARAIENQVFVAGVNRTGTDGEGIFYNGDSQMINARGEVMVQSVYNENRLLTFSISKQELNDFREKFPVSKDADHFLIH